MTDTPEDHKRFKKMMAEIEKKLQKNGCCKWPDLIPVNTEAHKIFKQFWKEKP